MPIYDYQCADCGTFEVMRQMAQRDAPLPCPSCGAAVNRVLLAAPSLADMPDARRLAMATNERAQHEPHLSSSHRHHAGCGCGRARSSDVSTTKSFTNKRPWMISH